MSNQQVVVERIYKAPIEKVWSAITDKDEMKEWYLDLKEFKVEVGFAFEFTGGEEGGKQYLHKCEITEVELGKKLTYSWRFIGYPGNSFVTFELSKHDDNGTMLRITHKGLETFPSDIPDFAKENFFTGWDHIMNTGLKEYLEKTGK
ncbi:MAG: SRPBCC domain-containing protein [Ignavibacteriae bacterium]|nr:SRPBCC domain-containing protein [Ignavibacteriota bacterium]